jgi:hypothetical protein
MLQESMNAWLLEHPEEEEQWLQVKGLLRSLGFSVAHCTGPIFGTNLLAPCIRDPEFYMSDLNSRQVANSVSDPIHKTRVKKRHRCLDQLALDADPLPDQPK